MWTCSCSSAIFRKVIFGSVVLPFHPWQATVDYIYVALFWALYSFPLIYLFFANTTLTWLLCLYKSLKSGGVCSPDLFLNIVTGLPWWLSGKEFSCSAGDAGSIPGLGRSTEEGNGNQLQYSWLGNPMVRGAWWAAVRVPKRVRLNKHCDGYSESFPFPYKL